MFTGIVEEIGAVRTRTESADSTRFDFSAQVVTDGTAIGDSISVNGCCLTVVAQGPGWWAADAVAETLSRTNLGRLGAGDPVNLERAVSLHTRLGGHLVQGHVDGVGRVLQGAPDLSIEAPENVRRYLVEKGSVTVDGISLTVVSVNDTGFTVAVIPHTMAVTTLGRRAPGDLVNLEADVMAKYAEQLLAAGSPSPYREL
ncbi:MAG TPA: riboflavin synthase [Acidimicrobiales bacterium]|jgi:riboflavin synthase|nr:riboflavin synthase [Acidimicrobiales bacterium]